MERRHPDNPSQMASDIHVDPWLLEGIRALIFCIPESAFGFFFEENITHYELPSPDSGP